MLTIVSMKDGWKLVSITVELFSSLPKPHLQYRDYGVIIGLLILLDTLWIRYSLESAKWSSAILSTVTVTKVTYYNCYPLFLDLLLK